MADFERQRESMVESQIRPNEVTDPRLISIMRALPRERFVPQAMRGLAYIDEPIEVFPSVDGAPARFLLAPMVLARLIQLASVEPQDKVLDVGCATGYSTAVLAQLSRYVTGLEPESELESVARRTLRELGLSNCDWVEGILPQGHEPGAPYDVILLNGSVPDVPETLVAQLREGGRLVAVLTRGPNMRQGKAYCFVKVRGEASGVPHFDAGAPPLPGFVPAPSFTF
jgi:protein-L-isoaspartate(D-aspartate) O-methyltransferase